MTIDDLLAGRQIHKVTVSEADVLAEGEWAVS